MAINPIHNARLNNIAFGGTTFDGALVKDSYISVEPNADLKTISRSFDGRNKSISIIPDDGATVTLNVDSQSPVNIYLSSLVKEERDTGNVVISDITVTTDGTLFPYKLVNATIMRRPTITKSQDMADQANAWVFDCDLVEIPADEYASLSITVKATLNGDRDAALAIFGTFNNTITL